MPIAKSLAPGGSRGSWGGSSVASGVTPVTAHRAASNGPPASPAARDRRREDAPEGGNAGASRPAAPENASRDASLPPPSRGEADRDAREENQPSVLTSSLGRSLLSASGTSLRWSEGSFGRSGRSAGGSFGRSGSSASGTWPRRDGAPSGNMNVSSDQRFECNKALARGGVSQRQRKGMPPSLQSMRWTSQHRLSSLDESARSSRSGGLGPYRRVSQRRGMPAPLQSVRHAAYCGPGDPMVEEDSLAGLGRFRRACGRFVESEHTQVFVLALITVNAAMIGAATFPAVRDDPQMSRIFDIVDLVALAIFTAESALQIAFHGPREFCRDGWLLFDFVIVVLSWVSLEVVNLQSFRIFRALRFITHIAVLRNLVTAIVGIVPSIFAIFMLLSLIFYIFAVMFTTLFKDYYEKEYTEQDYFGTLQLTLFTLFQFLCLDEWSAVAFEVTKQAYWAWAIFIAFILMTAFVVINLLIAVICEALQILRIAEEGMRHLLEVGQDPYGGEDPAAADGWATAAGLFEDGDCVSRAMLRRRVDEVQGMLDEMVAVQEHMGRTIQRLSMAVEERIEQGPEGPCGSGKEAAADGTPTGGRAQTAELVVMQRADG